MNYIQSTEELLDSIKGKSSFEIAREFTFWSIDYKAAETVSDDVKIIGMELYKRNKFFSVLILFCVAILTNSVQLPMDLLASFRDTYFIETPFEICKQYILGIVSLFVLTFFCSIDGLLKGNGFNEFKTIAPVIFGIAIIIGFIKTIYDIYAFIFLVNKHSR